MTSTQMNSTLDSLGIKRAGATTAAATTPTTAKKSATTLDQGDFLQLLTAQLKNQDPFAPMDCNVSVPDRPAVIKGAIRQFHRGFV